MSEAQKRVITAARALEAQLSPWHGEILVAVRELNAATEVVVPRHHTCFDEARARAAVQSAPWSAMTAASAAWEAMREGVPAWLGDIRDDPYYPVTTFEGARLADVLGAWFERTQRGCTDAERAALERALSELGCPLAQGFEGMTRSNLPVRFALLPGEALAALIVYVGDGP